MVNKKKYLVKGKVIEKDDSVIEDYRGYTYARTEREAVKNLEYRDNVYIRDAQVEEVEGEYKEDQLNILDFYK